MFVASVWVSIFTYIVFINIELLLVLFSLGSLKPFWYFGKSSSVYARWCIHRHKSHYYRVKGLNETDTLFLFLYMLFVSKGKVYLFY